MEINYYHLCVNTKNTKNKFVFDFFSNNNIIDLIKHFQGTFQKFSNKLSPHSQTSIATLVYKNEGKEVSLSLGPIVIKEEANFSTAGNDWNTGSALKPES